MHVHLAAWKAWNLIAEEAQGVQYAFFCVSSHASLPPTDTFYPHEKPVRSENPT